MTMISRTATGAALAALLCAPALAEDDFGGSFDAPAAEAQSDAKAPEPDYGSDAQAAADTAAEDGFGGSFDAQTPDAQSDAKAPEPDFEGEHQTGEETAADDGFGGSFDEPAPEGADQSGTDAETADTAPEDGSFDPDFQIAGDDAQNGDATDTAMPETQTQPEPEARPDTGQGTEQAEAPAISVDPQVLAFEARDFGVPPTGNLHNGMMHAPTPTYVPGAEVVSTEGLANAVAEGLDMVVVDVLGQDYALPNAWVIPEMAASGHFGDRVQQQTVQWLAQVTGQVADYPIILYCADPHCWLSYNATLRVVAAGYTNVYWYRGGITAWQMAGFPVYPSGY